MRKKINSIICLMVISISTVFAGCSESNNSTPDSTEIMQQSEALNSSTETSTAVTTMQSTHAREETTIANSKTYTITNETELRTAYSDAKGGDKFQIENAILGTDGTNYFLSYSGTGYPIVSDNVDLSKYTNKNVSITGTVKNSENTVLWDADSITSNSANNIVINDVSGNVIVPAVNPQVSYNGYKDLFEGVVIYGEIQVTEYFTQADLEQWGYNIQLYKTDVSEADSDDDMFTALIEGPAKNCNVSVDSIWASITEKAFAIKLPDNLEPGDYTIYFQQYGDRVGWDSFIKFTANK